MVLLRRINISLPLISFIKPWQIQLSYRQICCSPIVSIRSKNSNSRLRGRGNGKVVLLDRFIKYTPLDASLITKVPFHLKCSGSFFDTEGNVDSLKNFTVGQDRDDMKRQEKLARRQETRATLEEDLLGEGEEVGAATEDTNEAYRTQLPEKYLNLLKILQNKSSSSSDDQPSVTTDPNDKDKLYISPEDLESLKAQIDLVESGKDGNMNSDEASTKPPDRRSLARRKIYPVHVKLFGRSHHRVDSYSILTGRQGMTGSHIYISDADTAEQVLAMFAQSPELQSEGSQPELNNHGPSGSVSIWSHKDLSEDDTTEPNPGPLEMEELTSSLKVYCPNHLLSQPSNGIKAVFHTPIMMNRIFLECERQGCIDLNCKLMDQLATVGLVTEYGQVRIRDVWAHEIKLATRWGDIICDGTLEGEIQAQTWGDGDFVGRVIVGPSLRVSTDSGDICLWDDCFAELTELFTVTGHIHCRRMYGAAKIVIKNQGHCTVNVIEGSVDAVVKDGDIVAHLEKLNEDSYLEVETGNIHIHIPPNFPYRISLLASGITISPHILNSGEFFLAPNGQETFVSGVDSFPGEMEQPSLTVKCHKGEITLQGPRPEKQSIEADINPS